MATIPNVTTAAEDAAGGVVTRITVMTPLYVRPPVRTDSVTAVSACMGTPARSHFSGYADMIRRIASATGSPR